MALKTTFSPFFTTGKPGGSDILDRNLLAIKLTLDGLTTVVNETTLIVNPPAGSIADAKFWLSQASALLPNGVDLGALGTGVLQQTVAAGVATPQALPLVAGEVLYGGTASLIAQSADFYFDPVNVRLGIGTNAPQATLSLQRAIDAANLVTVSNSSTGTHAYSGVVLQASNSDAIPSVPFTVFGQLGRNYVPPPADDTPYFTAEVSVISYYGAGNFVFDGNFSSGINTGWLWTTRTGMGGAQDIKMSLTNDGHLAVNDLIGGGLDHLVYAIDASGRLAKVTIGANLTFSGGTLAATGGGAGTVTSVTGTDPIHVVNTTTTPAITLLYDGVSLDLSGGTTLRRAALTGDATAAAGSNALTLATVNASPGTYAYATVTVNAKGLATTVTAGATPQAPITWPAATHILVSSGTTTDPVGEAAFTYNTTSNLFRLDGFQGIGVDPGSLGDGKYVLVIYGNASQDRIYLRPGGITLAASGAFKQWELAPATTALSADPANSLLANAYFDAMSYTGGTGSATVALATTVYIAGPPAMPYEMEGGLYTLYVAAGISHFVTVEATDLSTSATLGTAGTFAVGGGANLINAIGGATQLGFFGATPVGQQTGGSATAGVVYTATEQAMLQKAYDCLRSVGLLS